MTEHPVSWLRLERYHLGELAGAEAARLQAHLADCADCRAILDQIEGDERALPPLPEVLPEVLPRPAMLPPAVPAQVPQEPVGRRSRRWPWVVLALAAAALVSVRLPPRGAGPGEGEPDEGLPAAEVQVKGGVLAVELSRERAGVVTPRPGSYTDGDRVQVRVSCPPGGNPELVILQGAEVVLPFPPLACGNRVVAGAVRLTGQEDTVICAIQGVSRARLLAQGAGALGSEAACVRLAGER